MPYRRPLSIVLLGVALCAAAAGCRPSPTPADLVLLDGKLYTLDPARPRAEALAARDGRIVAVGSDDAIRRLVGPDTRVVELHGRFAMPGFIEGHGHFPGLGRALMHLELGDARSWDEVVDRVAAAADGLPPGAWLIGWGWHQEKWDHPAEPSVEGYPTHGGLSAVTPHNPVLLKHAAGNHAGMANALALQRAGIDGETVAPDGGRILRDDRGRPTGVLLEQAWGLVLAAHARDEEALTAEEREARARREIELADAACLANGVTSFQDAGSDFATVDRLRRMAEQGRLGVRVWVMLNEDNASLAARGADYAGSTSHDGHVVVGGIKRSLDGALGSHGAWLLEPYADWDDHYGMNTYPLADLQRTAELAVELDLQLAVHAIGDRANREVLDLYERVLANAPHGRSRRWRVEHAQHLNPQEIPRFAALGVVASMQGVHCTSDGPWVPTRLGARRSAEGAYVWRRLLDAGAVVSNGTDTPVEPIDPIANFHATVTRRTRGGEAFYPDQRMTRDEALRAATLDAAWAAFEDESKGSLTPGRLADVTVLSDDLLAVPETEIRDVEVLMTIVGGKIRYEKG